MKILTLWLWAFGFAMNKLLWENSPNHTFYAFELNKEITDWIKKNREHPYFFSGYKLPENINLIYDYVSILKDIDLIIIAIPVQFISSTINSLKDRLKSGVTILNLAKWIDIKSNKLISELIDEILIWKDYNYAVLSWWMIASEVVEWKTLWADLWIKNSVIWNKIKSFLQNDYLRIKVQTNILNIELYGSLKNIMAIMVWYYEWLGEWKSSIWYRLLQFYDEMKEIIKLYGWNDDLDFSYYSLGWDIIATCFGNSRNHYLWQLLWSWISINQALERLKLENKHAEWYETLKAVYDKVKDKDWYDIIKMLYGLIQK
jgi:glycerol-3-phosphate dehydrogenase (NAD(P)+)